MRRACFALLLPLVAACGGQALARATPTPATPTPAASRSIVPWSDVAWHPSPAPTPSPPPAEVRQCRAADLVVAEGIGNGATGWIIQSFGLGNRSGTRCLLRGAPGVRLVKTDGRAYYETAPDATARTPSRDEQNWAVLEPATGDIPRGYEPLRAGQATFAFMTYGSCEHPLLARYEFRLPSDATPLVLPFDPPERFGGGRCDAPGEKLLLSVWSFSPAAEPTPAPTPSPSPLPIAIRAEAPTTVRRGDTLQYLVTLENDSGSPLALAPCPLYEDWIVSDEPPTTILNAKGYPEPSYPPLVAKNPLRVLACAAVPDLPAGAGATFAMRLSIAPSAPLGPATILFDLRASAYDAGKTAQPVATITVLP